MVRFYNDGGGPGDNLDPELKPLGLTDSEIDSLVAFLSALGSGEEPIDTPDLPAYEPRTLGSN